MWADEAGDAGGGAPFVRQIAFMLEEPNGGKYAEECGWKRRNGQ